jgi:hypothetical protein
MESSNVFGEKVRKEPRVSLYYNSMMISESFHNKLRMCFSVQK